MADALLPHSRILIAGGGMSGMSLVWHLLNQGYQGEILVFEKNLEERKERTWSFWQEQQGPFDHLAAATWEQFRVTDFHGHARVYPLAPFKYLSIKGSDFYRECDQMLLDHPQVKLIPQEVVQIDDAGDAVQLCTREETYAGDLVFDSLLKKEEIPQNSRSLIQHFYGYVVEFEEAVFDADTPDLMNFDTGVASDCHFIYILPYSAHKALIEYTIFSPAMLNKASYKSLLEEWIARKFSGKAYRILELEFNAIPMTDAVFKSRPSARHIRIGTAGGFTNPATGYTFYNSQKHLKAMAEAVVRNEIPDQRLGKVHLRFRWYHATLLQVLSEGRLSAHAVFVSLYRKNATPSILRFLNDESCFMEELKIMSSTNIPVFVRAGLKAAWSMIK